MALSSPPVVDEHAETTRAITQKRADIAGLVFKVLMLTALLFSLLVLLVLLVQVFTKGWGRLTTDTSAFLGGELRQRPDDPRLGIFQAIRGTFWIGVMVVVIAFPIGIGAGLYLEEYAPKSRFTNIVSVNIRNLAGVPSIVYGILGFAVFVQHLEGLTGGRSVLAAGITVALLVLPIVIITASEAIRAVPDSLREAGFGVGATRWEVIKHHVLPYAAPGILTGTMLALARALGEAAPLILVGAITTRLASNAGLFDLSQLTDKFTALPIVIAEWTGRPLPGFRDQAAAAAIIAMLTVVLLFNATAILLRNHFEKKR